MTRAPSAANLLLWRRGGRRLPIGPGRLAAPLVLTRAQTAGVEATALNADGVTWGVFGADVPRFNGTAQRLLVEGARTNGVRNPRGEGASAGVHATRWAGSATVNGVTLAVLGQVSEAGMQGVEVEFTGTASAAASLNVQFDVPTSSLATAVVAAVGEIWFGSVFHRLSSGTAPNGTTTLRITECDAAGAGLVNNNTVVSGPTATLARVTGITAAFGASAGRVTMFMFSNFNISTVVNCRIRYLWPHLEIGTFASTPILPPVGTPGVSSRGADIIVSPLASLGAT